MPATASLWTFIALAAVQLAFAIFEPASFYGVLALGWGAALLLLRDAPVAPSWRPSMALSGSLLVLLPFAWLAQPGYHAADRAAPLLSGAGLFLAAGGLAELRRRGRELLLLGLPLLSPIPVAIAELVGPVRVTAILATAFLGLFGVPAAREGNSISYPGGIIDVVEACSGILLISQLVALSLAVLCLCRTTRAQKMAIPLAAVAIGVIANGLRVAVIGLLARARPQEVHLWDGAGLYAPTFSAAAALVTCLVWWALLAGKRAAPS